MKKSQGTAGFSVRLPKYEKEEKRTNLFFSGGIGNDTRVLLENRSPQGIEAVDLFVYRIRKELGGFASVPEELDTVTLTAGIGENAPEIRQWTCEKFRWLSL